MESSLSGTCTISRAPKPSASRPFKKIQQGTNNSTHLGTTSRKTVQDYTAIRLIAKLLRIGQEGRNNDAAIQLWDYVQMQTQSEIQQLDSVPKVRMLVDSAHTGTRPVLSLVKSDVSFLCNRNSLIAESPRGSRVRPFSMSLRAVADMPTSLPISENDNPVARISEMRNAHKVFMGTSVRDSVLSSKRKPVLELHQNSQMTRPANLPKLHSIGERVRWWRKHRGFNNQREFAEQVGMSKSALSDLENGRTQTGTQLHLIAAKLGLNPHYLESDTGEPEASSPQLPPPNEGSWPFKGISAANIAGLNHIEKSYAEQKLAEALAEIEQARRQAAKRTG